MKHIVILYSELADYSLSCLRALKGKGSKLLLVHWPVNPEAPFHFDLAFCDETIVRDQVNTEELDNRIKRFKPDLILCSGWMDKGYYRICQSYSSVIPTVLSLDNHWTGSWKQRIAQLVAPFTIRKTFSHAFVPGEIQKRYALKLGFDSSCISTGFYAADADKFDRYYAERLKDSSRPMPKRFLYLGRYVQHKGIQEMWEAFITFRKVHPDWELWCVGTGDQYAYRVESEGIRHFGFIQPNNLLPILKEAMVYILPSRFEPWGVSVQEMAIAGFPLLLSDAIGAREAYLKDEENGKYFKAGSADAIYQSMLWMAEQSDQTLQKMGAISHDLGMRNTPNDWADTLLTIND